MTLMGPVSLRPPPTQQHVLRGQPNAARLQLGQREHLWPWQCHHKVKYTRRTDIWKDVICSFEMLSNIIIIWSFHCASIQLFCQVAGGSLLLWRLGRGLPQRHHGLLLPCCGFPVRFFWISLFEEFLNYVSARRVVVSMAAPLMGSLPITHGPGYPSYIHKINIFHCKKYFFLKNIWAVNSLDLNLAEVPISLFSPMFVDVLPPGK